MTSSIDSAVTAMADEAALPRRNGELVFEAPWESRAFATAVALADRSYYDWETFRAALISKIASWERDHLDASDAEWNYYDRWLAALEDVLISSGLLSASDIDEATAIAADQVAHEHHPHHSA